MNVIECRLPLATINASGVTELSIVALLDNHFSYVLTTLVREYKQFL